MIVNRIACDWLTWSVGNHAEYKDMCDYLIGNYRAMLKYPERAFWRNYEGLSIGDTFMGKRVRRKATDYIVVSHGTDASDVIRQFYNRTIGGKWTRVDLQVTVPEPKGYNPLLAVMALQDIGVNAHPYGSASGYTIQIGSRTSDRYWRIYQKPDADGGRWLRFELELKGELSRSLKVVYQSGGSYRRVYSAEFGRMVAKWERLPDAFEEAIDSVLGVIGLYSGGAPLKPMDVSDSDRMKWLRTQVASAMRKANNDHDTQWEFRRWITALLEEMNADVLWRDDDDNVAHGQHCID